jgi:hypothetical protein
MRRLERAPLLCGCFAVHHPRLHRGEVPLEIVRALLAAIGRGGRLAKIVLRLGPRGLEIDVRGAQRSGLAFERRASDRRVGKRA